MISEELDLITVQWHFMPCLWPPEVFREPTLWGTLIPMIWFTGLGLAYALQPTVHWGGQFCLLGGSPVPQSCLISCTWQCLQGNGEAERDAEGGRGRGYGPLWHLTRICEFLVRQGLIFISFFLSFFFRNLSGLSLCLNGKHIPSESYWGKNQALL